MKQLVIFSLSLVLTSCASKKEVTVSLEEAPKFDKKLNSSTLNQNEKVGIKDDTVKIQKVLYLEEDLSKTQTEIEDLENSIYGTSKLYPGGLYVDLKNCRQHLADPRIGGNGVPEAMEKWEKVSQKNPDFNYHVDKDKNVVAVSEEDLSSRITNLRKFQHVLNDKYDAFKEKLDNCLAKHRAALVDHGLDPKDMEAKGEWVDGPNGYRVWQMRKSSTTDPEELMKRKGSREKQQ